MIKFNECYVGVKMCFCLEGEKIMMYKCVRNKIKYVKML